MLMKVEANQTLPESSVLVCCYDDLTGAPGGVKG